MKEKIPVLVLAFFAILSMFINVNFPVRIFIIGLGIWGFFIARNVVSRVPRREEKVGDMVAKGIIRAIDKPDGFFAISLDKNYPNLDIVKVEAKTEKEAQNIISKFSESRLEKLVDKDISKRTIVKTFPFDSKNLRMLLVSVTKIIGMLGDKNIQKNWFGIVVDRNIAHMEVRFLQAKSEKEAKDKLKKLSRSYIQDYAMARVYKSGNIDFDKFQGSLVSIAKTLRKEIEYRTGEDYMKKIKAYTDKHMQKHKDQ